MSVLLIFAIVFAVAAGFAAAGLVKTLADMCYPDLVCQRCGRIMPGAGHECSEGR